MAKPSNPPLEKAVQPGEASNPDEQAPSGVLNSPELDEVTGKPKKRAITEAKQAYAIAKNLKDRAKLGRIKTAAVIADKYNGTPPFLESDLARTGETWRNNFSTNFLASIIDRVKPQMLDPVNKSDVLTHSALPSKVENAAIKSRIYCEIVSRMIRRWPAWRDFASQLAQENVLFGLAIPAWIDDPTEWRPRLWRFDEAFLPEGTGQHASVVQVAVFSQKMLLHEFIDLIQDKELAEKACYNFANCIKVANTSTSQVNAGGADETELQKEDRLREGGSLADSYDDKAKTVDLYHVLVRDYSGEVDLWTVTQNDGTEIRNVEALHESMEDALTLFTFQSGNGKLYGSKGLGRLLTNLHIAIERGRCLGADQMYLSGLIIFQAELKNAAAIQAKVRHPFVFVPKEATVVTEQIQFKSEAFEMMDAKLTQLAESIAGAFIPPNLNQEGANTKIEAAQNAEREMAVKEGVLGRFFDHLADLVTTMQRKAFCAVNLREGKRAYDSKIEKQKKGVMVLMRRVWKVLKAAFKGEFKGEPDVSENSVGDEEAIAAVIEMLENGLTVEDIAYLSLSPSAQTNATDGAAKDAATIQFIEANKQNPFIDQRAATQMQGTIAIGEDRAKQLIVPTEDPQIESIAIRDQIKECVIMSMGEPQPVVLSDLHSIHRKVLASKLEGVMATVQQAPTPPILQIAELFIGHYMQHLQMDQLTPEPQKQDEGKQVAAQWQLVEKTKAALAKQAAELQAHGVQAGPDGMPVPVNGQPPQVGPNGQVVGEPPARESIHPEDADLKLKIHEAGQEDQRIAIAKGELAMKAQDLQHKQAMDVLKLHQGTAGMLQEAGQDQQADAQAQADRDLQERIAQGQLEAQKDSANPQRAE